MSTALFHSKVYEGKLEGQKELLSVICEIVLNNSSQIVASEKKDRMELLYISAL